MSPRRTRRHAVLKRVVRAAATLALLGTACLAMAGAGARAGATMGAGASAATGAGAGDTAGARASAGASSAARRTYTLTLATWGSSKHPQVARFTKVFMATAARESHGRLAFKYFPDNQMVKEAFVSMAIPTDTVDISLTTMEGWAGRNPDVAITMTPLWSISQKDAFADLVPGQPIFDYLRRSLEKSNTRLLALFDIGPPVISSTFPLAKPADLDARIIRSPSKGSAELIKELHGSPAVMSVGDVYAALKLHTVDGALGGLQGYVGLKQYEVTRYLLATEGVMGTFIHGYVMNKEKFDALPPDLRVILQDAATTARNAAAADLLKTYPDYLQRARQGGVAITTLQPGTPSFDAWAPILERIKQKNRAEFNPALVKLVESAASPRQGH